MAAEGKLGPCMQCVRCMLFVFNTLFWLTGFGLLGVGIWVRVQFSDYMKLSSHDYSTACYVMIGAGVLVTIIGFLGCCGALKEQVCMLKTFAVILGFLFLVELGGSITGYVFRHEIKGGLSQGLDVALNEYRQDGFKEAWDGLQSNLECCGNKNYTDWFYKEWTTEETGNNSVPQSCCVETKANCNKNVTSHPDTVYSKGCYNAGVAFFENKLLIIGGVTLGIAVFQLLGVALSCCLASNIQHASKYELV
ncbi:Tetraspanin-7 [Desmophyllum pertusum]|uniref:Tetraspanin n=1 Tax=Desmophyllum pertusum TaxID=174260 RepID=A0A9W9ZHH4_9CNID|nr:Tetraspanin-7 [Desmophyllum pertusum]